MTPAPIQVIPVTGLPEFRPGDILADLIVSHADLVDGDVIVASMPAWRWPAIVHQT